jgi:hypothetical protein
LSGSTTRKYTTALTRTDTLSREITSCGGTSITVMRRSTRNMRWISGTSSTRPGPLVPVNRPSVSTTPRSYSGNTLTEENSRNAASTTSTPMNPNMSISLGNRIFGDAIARAPARSDRFHPQ